MSSNLSSIKIIQLLPCSQDPMKSYEKIRWWLEKFPMDIPTIEPEVPDADILLHRKSSADTESIESYGAKSSGSVISREYMNDVADYLMGRNDYSAPASVLAKYSTGLCGEERATMLNEMYVRHA